MMRVCPGCGARHPTKVVRCPEDGRLTLEDLEGSELGGRYVLRVPVAAGALASVWWHATADDGSAVTIQRFDAPTPDVLRRVAQVVAHEGAGAYVPGVLDHGVVGEDYAFLVYPFLPGAPLEVRLASAPVASWEARALADGLLEATARLHEAGALHGAIHPVSVFGDLETGAVALVDVGLTARPEATRVWDLYDVAAILYRALTGKRPREGGRLDTLMRMPRALSLVLGRALGPIETRYADARAFQAALGKAHKELVATREVGATAITPVGLRAAPEGGPRPSLVGHWAVWAGLLLALAAALAVVLGGCKGEPSVARAVVDAAPAITPMRIDAPDGYWEDAGFVALRSGVSKPHTVVWLKLPEHARFETRTRSDGGLTLAWPAGAAADRVDYVVTADGRRSVIDMRGVRIDAAGAERFHVLRPTGPEAGAPLAGHAWRRGDQGANDAAHAALMRRVHRGGAAFGGRDARGRVALAARLANFRDCVGCHAVDRPAAEVVDVADSYTRATDASGYFMVLSVLEDPLPSGDAARAAVCASRRYLGAHLDDAGKRAFSAALAACEG